MSNIHQVQKQYLHVDLIGTEGDGLSLQRSFPALCQNALMPALDRMLERVVPAHEYWFIDRLEIDAGIVSLETLERELIAAVIQEAERQLRSASLIAVSAHTQLPTIQAKTNATMRHGKESRIAPGDRAVQAPEKQQPVHALPPDSTELSGLIRQTEAQSIHDAFIHFLKTGSLPWWFHLPAGNSLAQIVQASWQTRQASAAVPIHFRRGLADVLRFASVQERLVQQFSADFLHTMLAILAPENAQVIGGVLSRLEVADLASTPRIRHFCVALWQTALAAVAEGRRQTADNLIAEGWNRTQDQQDSAELIETLLEHLAPEHARILSNLLAKLGRTELESEPFNRFSWLLRQSAFSDAFTGKRHTALSLVAECWNSLPEAERRQTGLFEQIKQHWPEVSNVREYVNAKAAIRPHQGSSEAHAGSRTGGATRQIVDATAKQLVDVTASQLVNVTTKQSAGASMPTEGVDVEEGIYINCAGLVLLNPFLPQLFKALGIADDDVLLQPARALCLLHYLATGQSIAPEYELQLPKLLCDLPLEHPVESDVNLTAAELEEAEALLGAAVRHWDALGNTSADGLRGAFLVRPGKLSCRSDGDWLLQVEKNSFDILLDQLPWGFGMVKLPWMEKMLWVEWR